MNITGENIFIKVIAKYFLAVVIFFSLAAGSGKPDAKFIFQNRNFSEFYTALNSQDTIKINLLLKISIDDSSSTSIAYRGALLMKKAELKKSKHEKLILFKEGRILLEGVIKKENQNAEFRFLRLIIQENCPEFLRYHDNIKEDADAVKRYYQNFPPGLKHAVSGYSKVSGTLKPADFEK